MPFEFDPHDIPATDEDRMRVKKRRTFTAVAKNRDAFQWLLKNCERSYVIVGRHDEFLPKRPHLVTKSGRDHLFDHRAVTAKEWDLIENPFRCPVTEILLVKEGGFDGLADLLPLFDSTIICSNYRDCYSGRFLSLARRVTEDGQQVGFKLGDVAQHRDQAFLQLDVFASEESTLKVFDFIEKQHYAGRPVSYPAPPSPIRFGRAKSFDKIKLKDVLKHPIWIMDDEHDEEWEKPIVSHSDVDDDVLRLGGAPTVTVRIEDTNIYGTAYFDGDKELYAISLWGDDHWCDVDEVQGLKAPLTLVTLPTIRGESNVRFLWTKLKEDRARRIDDGKTRR